VAQTAFSSFAVGAGVMRFYNIDAGNPAAFHGYASLVALPAGKLC
jgi:hypothetical protein